MSSIFGRAHQPVAELAGIWSTFVSPSSCKGLFVKLVETQAMTLKVDNYCVVVV